jgi:hypothetical protein
MELPEDVAAFISTRFASEDVAEARNLLSMAPVEVHGQSSARLLRCAAFAAQGSIDELRLYVGLLATDWRDVVLAGEYESKAQDLVQVRDLNGPLQV